MGGKSDNLQSGQIQWQECDRHHWTPGPTANGGPSLPRAKPTSLPKSLSTFQWTLLPSLPASSKNQPNNADHFVRVPRRYEAVQGLANMCCQKPSKENVTSAAKEEANNSKR